MESLGEARRARRAEARRSSILQAAARVFARCGFDKATTREIALEADVSEGTIYNYFDGKQQVVNALVDEVQAKFAALTAGLPAQLSARPALIQAVRSALDLIYDEAVAIRGLVSVMWDQVGGLHGYLVPGMQGLIDVVAGHIELGIHAGRLRPCDAAAAAHLVAGMIIFLAMPYLRGREALPSSQVRQQQAELVATVFLDGLAQQGGG